MQAADSLGVIQDSKMPFLAAALDFATAQPAFEQLLSLWEKPLLSSISMRRHKLGRRCLIGYTFQGTQGGEELQTFTLLGKVRARGLDKRSYALQEALWQSGFDDLSADGVSVPKPVGLIPEFSMWCQQQVPGVPASDLLLGAQGVALCQRIAGAIYKLHRSDIKVERSHTVQDELNILRERLSHVKKQYPNWAQRLERVFTACERIGAKIRSTESSLIHRDFYPEQLIVDDTRIYLLDLDLCCMGDPALDLGNFSGHLIEQSLRTFGDPSVLQEQQRALEQAYISLAGEEASSVITSYTTLTLARHIFISTQFVERSHCTERLLELCEERLALW